MSTGRIASYLRLMRVDRPVGTLLLLWPTFWGLWLATGGIPSWRLLVLFTLGVFVMRSAGCVVNDYADRHIDGLVKRTRQRPLPQGEVSPRSCLWLFTGLVVTAFLLVLSFNTMTILLSSVALVLTCLYPFAKRITSLPQVVLGLAFSWSIPLGFAAVSSRLPATCWLLLLATLCWIIAYDIQYALADREDDLKIGVKSMAVLLGRFNPTAIAILQGIMLILMHYIGWVYQLGVAFYSALCIAAMLFFYQQLLLARQKTVSYLQAFKNNNYVGLVIFLGLFITMK